MFFHITNEKYIFKANFQDWVLFLDSTYYISFDVDDTTGLPSLDDFPSVELPSGVSPQSGIYKQSAYFDSSLIEFDEENSTCFSDLELCTEGITLSFWLNITHSPNQKQVIFSNNNTYGVVIWYLDFKIHVDVSTADIVWSELNASLTVDNWHHIVFVWSKDSGSVIYVDAVKVAAAEMPYYSQQQQQSDDRTITIGGNSDNRYLVTGGLDELRFWNHVKITIFIVKLYANIIRGEIF